MHKNNLASNIDSETKTETASIMYYATNMNFFALKRNEKKNCFEWLLNGHKTVQWSTDRSHHRQQLNNKENFT